MKIRNKQNHQQEFTVHSCGMFNNGEKCYFIQSADGTYGVLSAKDWEPIPEPIWKPVTSECSFKNGLLSIGPIVAGSIYYPYRLVKSEFSNGCSYLTLVQREDPK